MRADMVDLITETKKNYCKYCSTKDSHCKFIKCDSYDEMEEGFDEALRKWLSSFDTNSATECFTAVNILKQRLEDDK